MAPLRPDQPAALQLLQADRDAGAANPEDLGKRVMGDPYLTGAQPVRRQQQPSPQPLQDRRTRAAFLLANDLALVLLPRQIAAAIGTDPLSPAGMRRWAAEVADVYAHGAFRTPTEGDA